MSDKGKISIVVLGTLKKNLISVILGRDVAQIKSETCENDTYKVMYNLDHYTANTDMCLLVVEDGFSVEDVQKQIEKLHETTGKPREEFIVVLPLRYQCKESYPFNCCTMEKLFSKLRKLAEDKHLLPTNKRSADQPSTEMETDNTESYFVACSRYIKELFTDLQKTLKGNHSDNKVNLVLLGMSGTGKSASGNTILGRRQFVSRTSSMPVTTECQVAETVINGTCVRVIDTPDIFDDEIESSTKDQHVTKCKQLLQSGPCVFLLVIQVGRFTDGERDILRKFEEAFSSEAKEQAVILFTCGEELQRADMSLEGFLQDCQPELKNIVDQCDRRCVVFENKATHQRQVTELMQTVIRMLNKYQNQ